MKALIEYVLRSDEILDCDEALLFEAVTRSECPTNTYIHTYTYVQADLVDFPTATSTSLRLHFFCLYIYSFQMDRASPA